MAIKAAEAIRIGRSLLGTSYSTMDCIGFIRTIIQRGAGGDPNYRCEGTNWLWDSIKNSGKYKHLTWRQEGIEGAKPGMLALMRDGTDDESHVGLVTERGTVLHSSKSRGCVVETDFTARNGWDLLAIHRHIQTGDVVEEPVNLPYTEITADNNTCDESAVYTVNASGGLRMRKKPSERGAYMQMVPDGTQLVVDQILNGYAKTTYKNHTGWVSLSYLTGSNSDEPDTDEAVAETPATEDNGYTPAQTVVVALPELEAIRELLVEALDRVNVATIGGVD